MTMTPQQFASALESGKYAFPGRYLTHFLMADGEAVCFDCAEREQERICDELLDARGDKDWQPVAHDIYWEGEPMHCANCNEFIESVYGSANND